MDATRRFAPQFSLIFPVYNPGPALEASTREVQTFLEEKWDDWEVIFVCDGCSDGSEDHLLRFVQTDPERLRVLVHSENRGKGHAVRSGLAEAHGRWRLFTDIDLAYSWDDVNNLAQLLKEGHEVVTASREHPQTRVTMPPSLQGHCWRRALQSRLFVALAHTLLPFEQRDPQAGLKGMSARVAKRVLPTLRCDGFAFDCEFLTACHYLNIPVTEVPVHVSYRGSATTTSLRASARMMHELWRIRQSWTAAASRNRGEEHERRKIPAVAAPAHTPGACDPAFVDLRPVGVLHSDHR